MYKYILIAMLSGILSSFSQILLKKSSRIDHKSRINEYLNGYVLTGYVITALCMLLMIVAYKGMPFKYGAIVESLAYFYIMILSKIFFDEQLTFKRVLGNVLIVLGVGIFSL